MKILFFLFNLLSATICMAQDDLLKGTDHKIINKFYLDIGIISKNSKVADSASYYTDVVPIYKIKRKSSDGIYVLIPPVEPYREYVMLLDDSCRVLKSSDLEYDLPLILSFLSKYNKSSVKQFTVLLERLAKTYQEKNPPKGTLRKM